MTHSRRSSEAPPTEAAGDPEATVDPAADERPEPSESAGAGGDAENPARPGAGKHAAPDGPGSPEKPHGDKLAEAVKGSGAADDNEVAGGNAQASAAAEIGALRTEIDERIRDLQRITAEYANYRKRVARDNANARNDGIAEVLGVLLPVLDDLDRAREHGDLTGPFGAVADQLTAGLSKFGLTPFGSKGDAFDPTRHEAVAHRTSAEVTEPSCVSVMRRGYLLGERLLRPAMVEVADPE
ncbi:nucleotide exchange factor GrpE [Virgisporangium aurantiacum]